MLYLSDLQVLSVVSGEASLKKTKNKQKKNPVLAFESAEPQVKRGFADQV